LSDTEFIVIEGDAQEVVEQEEEVVAHSDNLALYIDERELEEVAHQVYQKYQDDKDSRQDWEQMFEKGFELLGLKLKETSEPFEGACTAVHPLIIENAVKFQSKASQELLPPKGPVKTQIIGKATPDKEAQAKRVKEFMNYEISEMMPEYFNEFERLLFQLPIFGSAFKKVYYDAAASRPTCEFVSVDQFYVPFNAPNLQRADRFTHVIYRSSNDLKRDIAADMYRECDLGKPNSQERSDISTKMDEILGFSYDPSSDPQYCLLEQHCYLELGGDFETPVAAPYIVTIDEDSKKCLSIRRNWEEDDPQYIRLEHFIHYQFVPGFGFYGFGYIHFLGNLTLTATAAMRALIDAGQFANLPGGFKARGVRIVGDQDPIGPGEWREVESTGQQLDKSFYALPYKEPSQTLYNMLDFVTRAGQKFADTTEQVIADSSNYGPVGTTMALIEQSAKFFTAIHKRLHKSQRDEFRVLARVNYEFLPTTMGMDVADGSIEIFKEDFDGRIDVLPVSDPNIPSATHRLALAQMALQLSSQAPLGTYDIREVHKMILESSNIENVDRLMPPPHKPKPESPMADIISVSQGQPIKAFPEQNHQAHITFKNAFLNNPAQQQNPAFPQMAPLIQANISEHMLLQYQEEMMAMVGQDASTDEFAQAQAAQQLTQMAQMAAIGQQQGSVEQQSLELQKGDLQLRAQEAQVDATQKAAKIVLDNRKLDIEEQRVQNLSMKEGATLGYNAMRDVEDRKTKLIIEYAKFVAALAKDMEITFSKDSELFRAFPEAFKGAEGGLIQIKDAPTFYALQDKIMNYQEGSRVDAFQQAPEDFESVAARLEPESLDLETESPEAKLFRSRVYAENLDKKMSMTPEGDPGLEEMQEALDIATKEVQEQQAILDLEHFPEEVAAANEAAAAATGKVLEQPMASYPKDIAELFKTAEKEQEPVQEAIGAAGEVAATEIVSGDVVADLVAEDLAAQEVDERAERPETAAEEIKRLAGIVSPLLPTKEEVVTQRLFEAPKDLVQDMLLENFSPEVAAGILGNIDVETGGTFRHTQKQKGGSGVGLFQFTYVPMKRAYENYLKSTEKIDSSESQILFVIETLNNDKFYDIGKGHRKELKRVFKKGDVEEIATEFSKRFLRPGIPHLEKRIASALRNFKQED